MSTSINPRIFLISNSKYVTAQYFDLTSSSGFYIVNHPFFEFTSILISLDIKNLNVQGINYSSSIFSIISDFSDVAHRNFTICMENL